MGIQPLWRPSINQSKTKPRTPVKRIMNPRKAREPIPFDLLCVVHGRRRRQTLLDMSILPSMEPHHRINGRMGTRQAHATILCDLLCVGHDQNRQQILPGTSTSLWELPGGHAVILRGCHDIQNYLGIRFSMWPAWI